MARQEFRVAFDGLDVSADMSQRIASAIQNAVLTQLATLDFKGDFAARIGNGGTQGIQLIALSADQLGRAGLDFDRE